MKTLLMIALLSLAACVNKDINTPDGALRAFVDSRIGNVVTRQFVLDRVTGKMKQSFEFMSDEDFLKFADLRNVKKDSFKILSKSCVKEKCFLTYTIGYNSESKETKTHSEIKKIAEVILVEGKWLIADVTNVKTYHESMDPINPLE